MEDLKTKRPKHFKKGLNYRDDSDVDTTNSSGCCLRRWAAPKGNPIVDQQLVGTLGRQDNAIYLQTQVCFLIIKLKMQG